VIDYFLPGLLVGFGVAVAIGPMAFLTMRRTLVSGFATGMLTGLGVASADAAYALVAALGLTTVSAFLVRFQSELAIIGAVALCVIGVRIAKSGIGERTEAASARGLVGAYGSALGLTLTNPMTILFFAAVITGLNVPDTYLNGVLFVTGVFLGSTAWWVILTTSVWSIGKRLNDRLLLWLNRGSGAIILLFGMALLLRSVM
jgi:threonine/homoserine/homoserine lactone efflux protein